MISNVKCHDIKYHERNVVITHAETKDIIETNNLNTVLEGKKFISNLYFFDGIQLCPEILLNGMYGRYRVLSIDKW